MDALVRAELLLDREVGADLEQELTGLFGGFGFEVECRRELAHRSVAEFSWIVLAALPLHAFLSGLGSEAVKDIYGGVKSLARRKGGKQDGDRRIPLVLQDSDSKLRIVLEEDLPIEAYQQLVGLDLSAFRSGPLHYDRHRGAWRSELDEAGE
ncbi:hypothetical protein [Saccharopolyspora taberi]|uniref:Uncharacterized protein n=1 Tax=Saccharopolyspora taberi TaxID=60895 RepID=A0ABN3VAB2_9PSEU